MAGQSILNQLRKEVRRLRVQNNALRIVVQGVYDYYNCDDEGEQPEDAHGGEWESCFKCQARMALEEPERFRMERPPTTKGDER